MGSRGVTRPMALHEMQGDEQDQHDDHQQSGQDDRGGGMDRDHMLVMHHQQTLWIPWTLILLGCWLLVSPFTFGYLNEDLWVQPSGGRGPWFADSPGYESLRAWLMTWSDVASGALLVVLGWRALTPDRPVSMWAACFVGIWLVFAPVVLWSPSAAGFANATLVGLLVIALTILVPGMPNMPAFMQMGPPTPPGWSYNPSSWPQRAVLIALGFAGLVVSRYLAAFQLGYIDSVWDPFFGFSSGTEQVLNSSLSHSLPISDAGLGGIAYSFEFLMGFMGSVARWRTMPWMVTMFGILVIPLGLSHVALVMSMPVVVGAFCTLCLVAGLVMLPMVTLTVDEVVAMGQHVRQAGRRGDRDGSWWKVFWLGGKAEGCTPDERTPEMLDLPDHPVRLTRASLWGASAPPALVAVTLLGVLLYAAPGLLGVAYTTAAANVAHLGGALLVVVAVVAMGEVVRPFRLLGVPTGLAVAGLVWLFGPPVLYAALVTVAGLAAAGLSLPRGQVRDSYGSWDRVAQWPASRRGA